jgi:Na+/H+-dicarboxylate symporter
VVVFSILFGIALAMVREERRRPLLNLAESLAETMFIAAVAEPVSIAFGTSSCEAALPRAMEAMEAIGVPRPVVAFVMPTGHSFNLDGSTLYLSLASIFVAQAAGVHLSLGRQLLLMLTLMLTSKGVAGVSRAAIVILLGTAGSFRPTYGAALHSARYRPIDGYGAHLGQRAGQLPGNRGGLALGGRFRKRATIAGGDERGYRLRHRRGITVYPTAPLRFNRTA